MRKRGFILLFIFLILLSTYIVEAQRITIFSTGAVIGSKEIGIGLQQNEIVSEAHIKISFEGYSNVRGYQYWTLEGYDGNWFPIAQNQYGPIGTAGWRSFTVNKKISKIKIYNVQNDDDIHLEQVDITISSICKCSSSDVCCSDSCNFDPAGTIQNNICCKSNGAYDSAQISCKQAGIFDDLNYYTQAEVKICNENGWQCTNGAYVTCSNAIECGSYGNNKCYFSNTGVYTWNLVGKETSCFDGHDNDCNGKLDATRGINSDPNCCEYTGNEICDNKDNDCDGAIDEGVRNACGSCGPIPNEICGDNLDNNCNSAIDEGCQCNPSETKICGSNIGICKQGIQTCQSNGQWGLCEGEVKSSIETCDGLDNDCNNIIDDGCECIDGAIKSCGINIGECKQGTQTCINGKWGNCENSIRPIFEICDNKDNDCDTLVDEGCFNIQSVKSEQTQEKLIEPSKDIILEEVKEVLEEVKEEKSSEEKRGIREKATDLFSSLLGEIRPTTITETPEVKELCGNSLIDSGEDCRNCKDAVCPTDQYCDINGQCILRSNLGHFFKWLIIILIIIPSSVYIYYHVKKREVSKQDIWLFVIALLFIIFSLIILYLNISTISFSLFKGVDPSASIIVESDINNELNKLYEESGDVEFVACIKGKYNNGRYQIYDIEELPTISRSVAAIEAKGCSKINNLGTIHSHPNGVCEPSKQDIYAFGQKKDLIMGIICNKDTYGFYTKKNFDRSMFYVIKDVEIKEEFKKQFSTIYILIVVILLILAFLIIKFRDNIMDILKLFKIKKYPNLEVAMSLMTKTEKMIVNKLIKIDGILKEELISKLGLSKSSFMDAIIRLERSNLIVIKKEKDGERIYLSERAKR